MTDADIGADAVLQALPEPSLVVGTEGTVRLANRSALWRFGQTLSGGDLTALCPDDEAARRLRSYLLRCSGSHSPIPGGIILRCADGTASRLRCHGNLLAPARNGSSARILLRIADASDDRFSVLARKVNDLNEEVRRRRRAQSLLEEALNERNLLLRELHHRVKNNIHMLSGMLLVAQREAESPQTARSLEDPARRLAAVGAVHQMLYQENDLRGIDGATFVSRLSSSIIEASGSPAELEVEAVAAELPNDAAVPLALVLNELLANAVKHGGRGDGSPGRIRVRLQAVDNAMELSVEDDGPGLGSGTGAGRRSSGLGLVRGLARQLGGAFSIESSSTGGTRCALKFWVAQPAAMGSTR